MSSMLGLFGGGVSTQGTLPLQTNIPSSNPQYDQILQNALGNYQSLMNQYQGLYAPVGGGSSAYVQSIINPAIQSNAQLYGNVLQSQAQRGIRGSSFGDQTLANLTTAANTNVGDLTAQALNQQAQNVGNLTGSMANVGQMMNADQLARLGLINQQMSGLMQYNLGQQDINVKAQQANAGMFGGLMNALSSPQMQSLLSNAGSGLMDWIGGAGAGIGSTFGGAASAAGADMGGSGMAYAATLA